MYHNVTIHYHELERKTLLYKLQSIFQHLLYKLQSIFQHLLYKLQSVFSMPIKQNLSQRLRT